MSGISATSLRAVADAADVSTGLLQHYFGTKAALISAVDDYVIRVISGALQADPLPAAPREVLDEMSNRLVTVMAEHDDVVSYIGRALVEGESIGSQIFDALLEISTSQQNVFLGQDQVRDNLDLVWGALNPLLLRLAPVILRSHVERHLPEPFATPDQLRRWDDAVTSLIREGQLRREPMQNPGTPPGLPEN